MRLVPSLLVFAIAAGVVLDAVAGQKAKPDPVAPYKLGVCRAINHPDDIAPTGDAKTYLYEYLHKDFDFSFAPDGSDRTDTSVRIIEQPKHGRLVQQYPDATDYQKSWYQYIPDDNFEGYDKFVMEVSASGNTVQIYYTMGVASGPIGGMNEQGERTDSSLCDQPHWKISAVLNSDGTNTITSIEYQSSTTSAAVVIKRGQIYLPLRTLLQRKPTSATRGDSPEVKGACSTCFCPIGLTARS